MPRACVFCGASPTSREHIWPALKTALMLEHAQSTTRRVFPTHEYEQLYREQRPGPTTRIWLAAYDGPVVGIGQVLGADADLAQGPERGSREIYGATVSLGPVVLQVFGSTVRGLTNGMAFKADARIHQIWPTVPEVSWSPRTALDDPGLQSFAEAIVAALPTNAR